MAAVDSLAAEPVEERWVLLQGQDRDGLPVVALARRPLRWIDSPLLDQHNEVTLSYTAGSNGLPTEQALARLRELEQALSDTAGPRAQLLAHETHRGRRRLHVYSDSEDQNITESIDRWGRSLAEASVTAPLTRPEEPSVTSLDELDP